MNSKQEKKRDDLEQRLRAEAEQQSPAFSMALHQRIMANLKGEPAIRQVPQGRRMNWWTPVLAAAAILLVIFGLSRRMGSGGHGNQQLQDIPAQLTSTIGSLLNSAGPVEEQFSQAKYGYVDQDAHRLANFVIGQLDVLPKLPQSEKHNSGAVSG